MSQEEFAAKAGVSIRQLGAWEQGKPVRIQSRSLNKLAHACEISPRELLLVDRHPVLITTPAGLVAANIDIVKSAKRFLYVTGSRSRDVQYLEAILGTLADNPSLVHRRILFGAARTQQLQDHVLKLIELRDPGRSFEDGTQTLGIALYDNSNTYPVEASVCMNEQKALLVLPSVYGAWGYDTAIVFEDRTIIAGWQRWIDGIFNTSPQITRADLLPPVRDGTL